MFFSLKKKLISVKCEIGRDDKESCGWNSKPKIQRKETK